MKKVLSLLLALLLTYGCAAAETLSLSLIGDCTIGDQYKYRGYKSGFTYKISQAGLDYPFSLAADLFAQDDLTIANCEGCFTNRASTGKFMSLGAGAGICRGIQAGLCGRGEHRQQPHAGLWQRGPGGHPGSPGRPGHRLLWGR